MRPTCENFKELFTLYMYMVIQKQQEGKLKEWLDEVKRRANETKTEPIE